MQQAVPTRHEKRRVARNLGYKSEGPLYAMCEDPDGAGRPNLIDKMDILLDHARVHHPDAAIAIVQYLQAGNSQVIGERGRCLKVLELVVVQQPRAAKETTEAAAAYAEAMRQGHLSGHCDGEVLLREVEEAERAMHEAAAQLRTALADERARAHAHHNGNGVHSGKTN
jgi:hypothetical protein